jgi:hypothetical protein
MIDLVILIKNYLTAMARLRQAYEHLGHCKLESGQREAKVLSFETIGQEERFSGK